jgi:hypothetical protein
MRSIWMARRHYQQHGACCQAGQIGKIQDRRRLAAPHVGFAQQNRQCLITGAINRMRNDVGTIDRAQAGPDNKPDACITRRTVRPYDTGQRIHICHTNGLPAKGSCRLDHLGRMRRTRKKGKIAITAKQR